MARYFFHLINGLTVEDVVARTSISSPPRVVTPLKWLRN
jgi:hypothetical protein